MPSVATSLNIEIYFKITEAVWAGGDHSVFEKMMETWSHWAYSPCFDWWVCVFVCYGSLIARKEFGGQSWFHFSSFLYSFCSFIIALFYHVVFFLIFHYIFTNITIKKKSRTQPKNQVRNRSMLILKIRRNLCIILTLLKKKNPLTKLKKKKIRLSFLKHKAVAELQHFKPRWWKYCDG